jgi:hypothetical protein
MKLEKKPVIRLFDFFRDGAFDYVKPGRTKEWILNNFPDPDDSMGNNLLSKRNNIWRYGSIEFHFADDRLYSIFSDSLYNFDGGESLDVDLWLINEDDLRLINVLKILNDNNMDYEKKTCKHDAVRLVLFSGVELGFLNVKEIEGLNKNDYEMISFMYK